MSDRVSTVDFHVTAACTQSCTYCWGPPRRMLALGTDEALEVIDRLAAFEVKRVVFTGGDPLLRRDIVRLICHAASRGLEVAVSTTGDHLTGDFLDATSGRVALISLPLDGSSEALNRRSKRPGHFDAVMTALDLLRAHPAVDVKVCSPVTSQNIEDIPTIAALVDSWSHRAPNRVFYNVFQVFPRSWGPTHWEGLLVSDAAWAAMVREVEAHAFSVRINFLSCTTLDQLYVLIFPDGGLYVPSGTEYHYFGRFVDIEDLDMILSASDLDSIKHLRHSRGWSREVATQEQPVPRPGPPHSG